MEYERIHKVQTGLISPSKLRMKLIGAHHQRKKDGSNGNSARTSPSKLHDVDFVKSSLLATESGDFEEEVSAAEFQTMNLSANSVVSGAAQVDSSSCQPTELIPREDEATDRVKVQRFSKGDGCNSSSVHPIKASEDEYLDYDSTSSFEFHKGERSLHHHLTRSFSRPMSSKWEDAEKWIMNRQTAQANSSKKSYLQNQVNRVAAMSFTKVAPESASYENKLAVKRVDFCQAASQMGHDKFDFIPSGSRDNCGQANAANALIDLCPESKDLMEVDNGDSMQDTTGTPAIRSVSMRDMGTEMTPIPSQEPSRTATPLGATTPTSSIPSTPRRGEPAPTPIDHFVDNASQHSGENGKTELSEQELKQKTRREIVALGVQLGKMNIATWASKEDKEKSTSAGRAADLDELEREFAKRAAAWEEAEKSKHTARFKREEIKVQAWESQQKAKIEADMRRIEAQVEQMRAQAQAKLLKKIAMARQKSEEMLAAAEDRRNRKAEKVKAQAEYIRHTGQMPSSSFICCGWS